MEKIEDIQSKSNSFHGGSSAVLWLAISVAAMFILYLLYDWYRGYRMTKRIEELRLRARLKSGGGGLKYDAETTKTREKPRETGS